MTYNRFIQGLGLAGVEVDRKILADLAVNDIAAFNALVEVAKAALPEDVNAPRGRGLRPDHAPLTAGNARVKEARRLSRRSDAPSGGCSLPTARRPSRPRSRPAASSEVFARAERRARRPCPTASGVDPASRTAPSSCCPTR